MAADHRYLGRHFMGGIIPVAYHFLLPFPLPGTWENCIFPSADGIPGTGDAKQPKRHEHLPALFISGFISKKLNGPLIAPASSQPAALISLHGTQARLKLFVSQVQRSFFNDNVQDNRHIVDHAICHLSPHVKKDIVPVFRRISIKKEMSTEDKMLAFFDADTADIFPCPPD